MYRIKLIFSRTGSKEREKGIYMKKYPDQYLAFFHHFHTTKDYFECHEVLEELWLECGRDLFYQGLLQVAVGLFHHRNGNLRGAMKMLRSALAKLQPYPEVWEGIHVANLAQKVSQYIDRLEREGEKAEFQPLSIQILDPELKRQIMERFS